MPLTSGREGEPRGPEPGDAHRPRHYSVPGEGTGGRGIGDHAVHAGIRLSKRMPFLRFGPRSSSLVAALFVLLAACAERAAPPHADAADDFGVPLAVGNDSAPARIVSLNPATTEILFAIGAGERLVGRSTWDLWPDSARRVPDMGAALRPNLEMLLAARPDLVVLYASEDNRPAAERLRAAGIEVLAVRGDRIADFRRVVTLLGTATGREARARTVVDSVDATLARVRASGERATSRPTVFVHVWDEPVITVGAGSFMSELVGIAGGRNVYGDLPGPSAQVSTEDVVRRDPDVMLAGPVGAARMRSDAAWRAVPAVREGRILVADTGLIARPSVKLGEAAVSLLRLLHPELAQ